MTAKEQTIRYLRDYLAFRQQFPWIFNLAQAHLDLHAKQWLNNIGGMAGTWRVDYPECTYYYPQWIDGRFVDLCTVEKVRIFYEQ